MEGDVRGATQNAQGNKKWRRVGPELPVSFRCHAFLMYQTTTHLLPQYNSSACVCEPQRDMDLPRGHVLVTKIYNYYFLSIFYEIKH